MKFKISNKIQFIDLAEHIKPSKSYNVTILEAKVRETGFNDKQLEQIAQIIATTVPPLIAEALVPINKRLDKIEADIAEIKSLPTIAKELKDKNK